MNLAGDYVVVLKKFTLTECNIQLFRGDKVHYDGARTLTLDGGQTLTAPSFKGAIQGGWALPPDLADTYLQEEAAKDAKRPQAEAPKKEKKKLPTVWQDQQSVSSAVRFSQKQAKKNGAQRVDNADIEAALANQAANSGEVGAIGDQNDRLAKLEAYRKRLFASVHGEEETSDGQSTKLVYSKPGDDEDDAQEGIKGLKAKVVKGSSGIDLDGQGKEVARISKKASSQAKKNMDGITGRDTGEKEAKEPGAKYPKVRVAQQTITKDELKAINKRRKEAAERLAKSKRKPPRRVDAYEGDGAEKIQKAGYVVDDDTFVDEEKGKVLRKKAAKKAEKLVQSNPYPEKGTDKEKIEWLKEFGSKSVIIRVYRNAKAQFRAKLEKAFPEYAFKKELKKLNAVQVSEDTEINDPDADFTEDEIELE